MTHVTLKKLTLSSGATVLSVEKHEFTQASHRGSSSFTQVLLKIGFGEAKATLVNFKHGLEEGNKAYLGPGLPRIS